jgi:hypothetical protein
MASKDGGFTGLNWSELVCADQIGTGLRALVGRRPQTSSTDRKWSGMLPQRVNSRVGGVALWDVTNCDTSRAEVAYEN